MVKFCQGCETEKPLDGFLVSSRTKRLFQFCKECQEVRAIESARERGLVFVDGKSECIQCGKTRTQGSFRKVQSSAPPRYKKTCCQCRNRKAVLAANPASPCLKCERPTRSKIGKCTACQKHSAIERTACSVCGKLTRSQSGLCTPCRNVPRGRACKKCGENPKECSCWFCACGARKSSKDKASCSRCRTPGKWGFGRKKVSGGYISVLAKGHPAAQGRGYVPEHRLVMERHIGRYLRLEETVHHINGIRDDNRIENLELWDQRHPRGQRVSDKIKFYSEFLSQHGYTVAKRKPKQREGEQPSLF